MSDRLSRRSFLKGAVGTGLTLTILYGLTGCGGDNESSIVSSHGKPSPVLFISIDSLPPSYLELNSQGEKGGRDGDWLMPNLMRFLEESTLFTHSRGYLPAATDMNHLNAVAGTSSAQTGVISVSVQPYNWNADGTIQMEPTHVSWFRDEQGRPVDTLFNAWKRKWPQSKTMYIAGREPILDAVRDVDREFGRLLEGLRAIGHYKDMTIVLYSDHGHINHLFQGDFGASTDMVEILHREGLISPEEKRGIGFAGLGVSSVGGMWWKADSLEERQAKAVAAKDALLRYEVLNLYTGERECPWYVGAHEDMIKGVPGYAEPGELWHAY